MIKLIQIVGESYNLETGQETKKALVLSNGIRQLSVEVSDEVIRDLIMMQLEASQAETPSTRAANHVVVQPVVVEETSEEPVDVPTMAAVADAPVDEDPGFEYADSSTGTASI